MHSVSSFAVSLRMMLFLCGYVQIRGPIHRLYPIQLLSLVSEECLPGGGFCVSGSLSFSFLM